MNPVTRLSELAPHDGEVEALDELEAPKFTQGMLAEVEALARRDLGLLGSFGAASMLMMGLAVPVRVLRVRVTGSDHLAVWVVFDSICGRASTGFPFKAPMTDLELDLFRVLEPALALRDTRYQVPVADAIRGAWDSGNLGICLARIRRDWKRTGTYIPKLTHLRLGSGVTLESWVEGGARKDDLLASIRQDIWDAVGQYAEDSRKMQDATRKRHTEFMCQVSNKLRKFEQVALDPYLLLP